METGTVNLKRCVALAALAGLTLAVAVGAQFPTLRGPVLLAASTPEIQAVPAETGVRDALQRYSAALEALDANALKKVQPSIPVDSVTKAFKNTHALKVVIDNVTVLSTDGTTARVSYHVTQTLTRKVGPSETTTASRVMRLRRSTDAWVIEGFER